MKIWLILLYLVTTVIADLSQEVEDGRITDAVTTPLPQDVVGTDEPKKGNGLFWNVIQTVKHLFIKAAGNSEGPEGTERNGFTFKILPKKLIFRIMETSANNDKEISERIKTAQEDDQREEIHEEGVATTNLNRTSYGIEGEEEDGGTTTACKQTDDFGAPVQECQNATALSPVALTTAEPATTHTIAVTTTDSNCLSQNCQSHSNLWAACTDPTPKDEAELYNSLTEFAIEAYKTAIQHEKNDSNFIFSPMSISIMLSNLLLGACGETKQRLENLLFYPENFACVHKALKSVSKSETLLSANAIFYQPELSLGNDFLNQSEMFYKTKMFPLTKNSHQDLTEINAWVSKNTNHKIKKLLNDLDPNDQMVLLNAVYFRSKWKTVFKVKNTKPEEFYRPGFPPIKVPMMTSKKYPVASFFDNNLQAKVARFQLHRNMSLVIVVPRSLSQHLSEVEERLNTNVIQSVLSKLEYVPFKPTIVTIPKFKVESSQDITTLVQDMDYGIFFETNLCGISQDEELQVSTAYHRAMMEISEEGVEAAATTAVSVARTANFLEVQQPFLFILLKDMKNIVFMGRINNPVS
ncbi:plasma protease C1 inhibitor [Varanus komodoensis]|uniref:Serpin family G member 1 n=1 Tax=Varanus komodoensis TaxID=61221 RepID=A0A8D2LGU7_VARKO|nr:plasma protease C1 inhibitor [Varanus komodoensis]